MLNLKIELRKSLNTILIIIALAVIYRFSLPYLPGIFKPAVFVLFLLIGLISVMSIFKREYEEHPFDKHDDDKNN